MYPSNLFTFRVGNLNDNIMERRLYLVHCTLQGLKSAFFTKKEIKLFISEISSKRMGLLHSALWAKLNKVTVIYSITKHLVFDWDLELTTRERVYTTTSDFKNISWTSLLTSFWNPKDLGR